MSYFGGSAGMVGDPGRFGSLFKWGRALAGKVFRSTPVGLAAGAVFDSLGSNGSSNFVAPTSNGGPRIGPVPGARGAVERFLPGGASGMQVISRRTHNKDGTPRRIRKDGMPWKVPTMNVGNVKSLKRAIRRQDRFVDLAKDALKNSGFKVVSKSAGKMTEAAFQKRQHHAK